MSFGSVLIVSSYASKVAKKKVLTSFDAFWWFDVSVCFPLACLPVNVCAYIFLFVFIEDSETDFADANAFRQRDQATKIINDKLVCETIVNEPWHIETKKPNLSHYHNEHAHDSTHREREIQSGHKSALIREFFRYSLVPCDLRTLPSSHIQIVPHFNCQLLLLIPSFLVFLFD